MLEFPKEISFAELTHSNTAVRFGIDNTPDKLQHANLLITANHMLRVRKLLNSKPILISSGYRCPKLNRIIGGSKTSAHTLGYAVDFTCPAFADTLTIAQKISTSPIMDDVDQLIHEYGSWVHISFDPRKRGQLLTIDRKGTHGGLH